jgi:hypothetical protein
MTIYYVPVPREREKKRVSESETEEGGCLGESVEEKSVNLPKSTQLDSLISSRFAPKNGKCHTQTAKMKNGKCLVV